MGHNFIKMSHLYKKCDTHKPRYVTRNVGGPTFLTKLGCSLLELPFVKTDNLVTTLKQKNKFVRHRKYIRSSSPKLVDARLINERKQLQHIFRGHQIHLGNSIPQEGH